MGLYSWGHPFKQFGPESSKFTSLFDKCDMRTAAICTPQWSGWSHRAVKGLAGWMLHTVGNRSHGKSMRVGYGIRDQSDCGLRRGCFPEKRDKAICLLVG